MARVQTHVRKIDPEISCGDQTINCGNAKKTLGRSNMSYGDSKKARDESRMCHGDAKKCHGQPKKTFCRVLMSLGEPKICCGSRMIRFDASTIRYGE
ncbi:MAG: hypothetical protein Q7R47_02795 [Candidatus Diapherotrites archaeon]|nr:hypothetical protein [Candidatus Diapherotrites archaeon]